MRKLMLVTVLCVPLFGTTCGDAPLVCADPVDGSDFGFAFDVPAGFSCTSSFPVQTEILRGFVTLEDTARGIQLLVLVGSDSDSAGQFTDSGVTCNDLGAYQNAGGISFDRCRFDEPDQVSYAGTTELPTAGNLLLVTIVADQDDPSLSGILESILDGVSFTQ